MNNEIEQVVVSSIVDDILQTLPHELLQTYSSPPGRKPSGQLIEISQSISKLQSAEAERIIRDVTDHTIFSVLYLIDANFKNANIATKFSKFEINPDAHQIDLVTLYRSKVDPGGNIAVD